MHRLKFRLSEVAKPVYALLASEDFRVVIGVAGIAGELRA